ncbi:MAG: hypothetical protein ABIO24_07485 [Saprospiraceae bacterium]
MPLPVRNARFLPLYPYSTVALLRDLQTGLRYSLNSEEHTLSWDTTYQDLKDLSFVHHTVDDRFGRPVYQFEIPLLLGILEISGLQVNIPDTVQQPSRRLDVPLDHLQFEVRLEGDGADNYWQMKAYFTAALGEPLTCWERDDQLNAEWNSDGLIITITYWFKTASSSVESGFAALTIHNGRVFPPNVSDV